MSDALPPVPSFRLLDAFCNSLCLANGLVLIAPVEFLSVAIFSSIWDGLAEQGILKTNHLRSLKALIEFTAKLPPSYFYYIPSFYTNLQKVVLVVEFSAEFNSQN